MATIGGLNGNVGSVALCPAASVRTAGRTIGNLACAARRRVIWWIRANDVCERVIVLSSTMEFRNGGVIS